MINFIGWIILGGLAGWIASKIMGRDAQMGVFLNIVVGIIGSFIGGWVLGLFGADTPDGFNIASFLTALLGAVILLFLVGLVTKKR
ncbi:GlsB/YeaQ/YmgE family stress response membrane protein [Corynebacterium hindlerae]|uniref:GlsB/YeaQ/YmgE family stress response membrane protein n=1 Tax=Corynebacterium hindlerae TaxID=699041 RepID=UPI0031B6F120